MPRLFPPSEQMMPFVPSVRLFAPGEQLAPFVRSIMVLEGGQEGTRTLLPDPGITLGIAFRGSASQIQGRSERKLPSSAISGMGSIVRRIRASANGGNVLVTFKEAGAAQFFAEPLHEFLDTIQALDDLVPRADVDRLSSRIADSENATERSELVEQFLCARLRPREPDRIVAAAVRAIRAAHGSLRIGALAKSLHISQDAFEKRFRRTVGTSPKHLASIIRLRQVVDSYRPGMSLSRLSLDAGYCDQSHFHREFRAAVGSAPNRFFKSEEYY
ncbi:AraC family transcriptional regulator [Myxococcus llanfairpwllgwyngyllgogerychwyrndrobwllllantysiliogogogochensis]|uniref:AraC family transcriptional regulator n=1 Tax=Myxococcus llanfairpwllgwyngyllgogerychwyrndrobwllllantysiliogogogochensis TaxID=2590453 RepID=A0A540X7V2_9BACT|nr:helix-turn-helix domain-containing protein [Myxococcus llanfairpwllgwyngyllgogerychwyrndrobwllllantysiliogogogochensis]TQF17249.1 AraC family transcriptional regulator [Myxococcus llanfairpwllgwyngyllgogerychwyrndrobwllllantysiliogogogochensis]